METPEPIRAYDSRGMGVFHRPVRRLPSFPNPPILKEVPMVLPQFSDVPVHLLPFWPSHAPTSQQNDCKGNEAEGPHKGSETSTIPGLADQGPILGGGTSEHSDCGRPYAALRVDNQSKEVRTQTHSGIFLFVGYEYHLDSALVKPTQERWLKL